MAITYQVSYAHETFLVTKCYLIEVLLQFLICIVNAELFETVEIMVVSVFPNNIGNCRYKIKGLFGLWLTMPHFA